MSPRTNSSGYKTINLYNDGNVKHYFVHRLVAKAFIPNPENKPYINHKDCDKNNNNVSNLEWCTHKENIRHAFDNGLKTPPPRPDLRGEKSSSVILTKEEVIEIIKNVDNKTQIELGKEYGVDNSTISRIQTRSTWSHIDI